MKSTYLSIPLIISMAGKGHFMCRGKDNHLVLYDIPDDETVKSFAEKTPCEKCGAKIDFSQEFNG